MKYTRSPGNPILIIILLVLACIIPDISRATEPFAKVVTNAVFLRFPRGARSISLGGSGVADPTTQMNTYYNPAVAFLIDGIYAVQGYNEWPTAFDLQDYGLYANRSFALGNTMNLLVGGGVRYTHLRFDPPFSTIPYLPEGQSFGDTDYYLTLTAGGGVSTRWIDAGVGFSAKPVNLTLNDQDDWFWSYDAGLLIQGNLPEVAGLRIIPAGGVSILNLNKDADIREYRVRLPDEVRLGARLRIESPASEAFEEYLGVDGAVAALSLLYEHMDRQYENGKDGDNFGVELTFVDAFSMRIGHSDQIFGSGGTTYGMGIGWRFRRVRVQFDVASFPTASIYADALENSYGITITADI